MAFIDEPNLWIAIIGVLLGILVSVIVGNHFRKKNAEDAEKILKNQTDIVTQNLVDTVNAQERVRKIGGKVVYRENNEIGADLKGGKNEKMKISENAVPVLNPEKQVVSRHTKNFTIDAVFTEKDQKETPKDDKSSSVETNMRSIRKLVKIFNPQPLVYNETLFCGCKAKDKIIVNLCQSDRQRYIGMMYAPPEGYYISEDVAL